MLKKINTKLAVLGGGPAGYTAALKAVRMGSEVALIEEREIGGTCLNRGCIPTKALLRTAEITHLISKRSAEFGINSTIFSLNWGLSANRKERVVKSLRRGLEEALSENKVQIIRGKGEIKNPQELLVCSATEKIIVKCDRLIIATGSKPLFPSIPGIKLEGVITSEGALELVNIPEAIIIIGAGAIGLEFASMFHFLGSKVTIIEVKDSILPSEDPEITAELLKIMKRQGISFNLSSKVKEIRQGVQECLEVIIYEQGKEKSFKAAKVLISAGRELKSRTEDILALGLKLTKGALSVNRNMETNLKGVYAAGDVIGGRLLAHLAFAEGRCAAQNALGMDCSLNYDAIPSCIYTSPEIASVGLSEEDAVQRGIEISVGRFEFRKNGRALCLGERDGLVKVIVDRKTSILLGACILGPLASELISEITLAVYLGVKAALLAEGIIHPHPTLSEAVMEACAQATADMYPTHNP